MAKRKLADPAHSVQQADPGRRSLPAHGEGQSPAVTLGKHLWQTSVRYVPAVLPIIFISSLLERYSGTALWLPHSFRELVLLVSSIFGTMVFAYYRPDGPESEHHVRASDEPSPGAVAAPVAVSLAGGPAATPADRVEYADLATPNPKRVAPKRHERSAIGLMLLCIAFLGCFVMLRQYCVLRWDSSNVWLDMQRKDPNVASDTKVLPLQEVLLNLPSFVNIEPEVPIAIRNAPFWKRWWWTATGTGPQVQPELAASAEILLPLWYPAAEKVKIQNWDNDGGHGVAGMLAINPNQFKWLMSTNRTRPTRAPRSES
jgi:hypothetical protein